MSAAYATHVPVLRAIASHTTIRRVLEFGGGDYSTRLFLDRDAFPDLEHLTTLESAPVWAYKLRESITDPRWELLLTAEKDAELALRGKPKDYGLALIDGETGEQRGPSLLLARAYAPILVCHDTERDYWVESDKVMTETHTAHVFDMTTPETTVWIPRDNPLNERMYGRSI